MMDGEHETIYVSRAAAGLMLQVCPLFVCNISTLCWGIALGLFWMWLARDLWGPQVPRGK